MGKQSDGKKSIITKIGEVISSGGIQVVVEPAKPEEKDAPEKKG